MEDNNLDDLWEKVSENLEEMPIDLAVDVIGTVSKEVIMQACLGDDFDPERFVEADNNKIHSVYLPKAFVSASDEDGFVWFKNVNMDAAKKWLYFIGAESEAMLLWFDGVNILFGNVSPGRLDRFLEE